MQAFQTFLNWNCTLSQTTYPRCEFLRRAELSQQLQIRCLEGEAK